MHVGDVVGALFNVEQLVLLGDEKLDLVGFVLDVVDDEVALELVEALGLFSRLLELELLGEAVEVLRDAPAIVDHDVHDKGGAAVDDVVDVVVAGVAVYNIMRNLSLSDLIEDLESPLVAICGAVVAVVMLKFWPFLFLLGAPL